MTINITIPVPTVEELLVNDDFILNLIRLEQHAKTKMEFFEQSLPSDYHNWDVVLQRRYFYVWDAYQGGTLGNTNVLDKFNEYNELMEDYDQEETREAADNMAAVMNIFDMMSISKC